MHCFFDWNSIKIPLKFHQNTTQILENTTKIPSKYHKNSIRIPVLSAKKWVVFHRNNSGKHAVNLDKIGSSIPSVFQWNSIKIPLWFQMFTSGMPAEFLWNTTLKFQHFFLEGTVNYLKKYAYVCSYFMNFLKKLYIILVIRRQETVAIGL